MEASPPPRVMMCLSESHRNVLQWERQADTAAALGVAFGPIAGVWQEWDGWLQRQIRVMPH